jgi:hypothetical protein
MLSRTRCVLLAGFCLYSTAFCALGTEEFANPPTPLPVRGGEQIAASLVDLIFLFDRVASDPPTATTRNYLERIVQPSSPFCSDYLEYRRGAISRGDNGRCSIIELCSKLTAHRLQQFLHGDAIAPQAE